MFALSEATVAGALQCTHHIDSVLYSTSDQGCTAPRWGFVFYFHNLWFQVLPPSNPIPVAHDQIHFAGLTAAPPPPPSHPAPSDPPLQPRVYPDTTAPAPPVYFEAPIKLPPGVTNPPPPPSTSPPPPPPGTASSAEDAQADTETREAQNEAGGKSEEAEEGNVISAAPQIRQNLDLNDGECFRRMICFVTLN